MVHGPGVCCAWGDDQAPTRDRPGTDSIGLLSRPDLRAGGLTTPRHLHRTIHGGTILPPIATPPRSRCGRDSWQILFRSIAESPPGLRTGTATRNRLSGPSCGHCCGYSCGHAPDPWPGPFGWGGPSGSRGLRWSGAAGEGLATERLAGWLASARAWNRCRRWGLEHGMDHCRR